MKKYKGVQVGYLGLPVLLDTKIKTTKKRVRDFYNISFNSKFKKDSPKNLLVMYDIPHDLKKERDWLRRHLIRFGYIMIQKSVWVGPSPLQKEFLEYLKKIKIGNNFKTFKLNKAYNPKGNK